MSTLREALLLPCPFCGGTSIEIRGNGIGDYYALCYDTDESEISCGARTSDRACETKEGAIRRWNKRAAQDAGVGEELSLALWLHDNPHEHARLWPYLPQNERDEYSAKAREIQRRSALPAPHPRLRAR